MNIKYLGHSCFKITSGAGTVVVTDPYSPQTGLVLGPISADVVTVSHHHFDHDAVGGVQGRPVIIDKLCGCTVKDVKINSVKSFHDDAHGRLRGGNIIFKFLIDGLTVCHLGDLGENCSEELAKSIGRADVLLIPVGGNYTIDAARAMAYVKRLEPSVVVPMHYHVNGLNVDVDGPEKFLELAAAGGLSVSVADGLDFGDGLKTGEMRVVLLRRE